MIYIMIWFSIVGQRLIELWVANRNERWMKENGATIVEEGIYKWIVLTHVTFLMAILVEGYLFHHLQNKITVFVLFLFLVLQVLRMWCLTSLGRFWNTKIIVLPKVERIRKGPYKYVRHPNYIIVGLEFIIIPILFHAYVSAVLFPLVHSVLMYYRIPAEERALKNRRDII
ncbi:isoprenylcysteine carboxyl methyltransferase family protein [Salirhabdus sp. Marseille-P4669]|uniref:isoprenylcysteine carboxyl methyltransferase family protein n=1 Tax=Salirhabdus sp. Marseille-P4669 TaxID=2042310 RepID=UPI000C79924F|nr:isoprenylcysteine carboxylmethyltransferase family protein [Salirhabdus sp. Marseille-P4669]